VTPALDPAVFVPSKPVARQYTIGMNRIEWGKPLKS
jgi:hypothetical protein